MRYNYVNLLAEFIKKFLFLKQSVKMNFSLVWRHNMDQHQINVETTLSISMLEFTISSNVKSTLCISTLMWATLDNVEAVKTTLSFLTSNFATLVNVKTTLRKWTFPKRAKKIILNLIHWIQSFNYFTLLPILWGICWKILANYYIARTLFKLLHFVKYWLTFNFTRALVQVQMC